MSDYWRHLGLNRDPFTPLVRIEDIFFSARAKQQIELLQNLTQSGSHLFLVTGIKGVGKTTLMRYYKAMLKGDVGVCEIMADKSVSATVLEQLVVKHLNLSILSSPETFETLLQQQLKNLQKKNEKFLLVIDNAHALPEDAYSFLMNIGNQLSHVEAAMTIVLVGGPQLTATMDFVGSHLLGKSVTHTFQIEALTLKETEAYVQQRLLYAGIGEQISFSARQWEELFYQSQGVAAKINLYAKSILFERRTKTVAKKNWWKLNVIKK